MRLSTEQWDKMAAEFGGVGNLNTTGSLRDVVRAEAEDIKATWREDAKEKAGAHGKLYPDAIGYSTTIEGLLHVKAEVGPDADKPQGDMSFEFGSRNQPPHLSGQKAAQESESGRLLARMDDWLDEVINI